MVINVFMVVVLAICIYTDILWNKIYNKVIFPSLLFAFIYHILTSGVSGFTFALLGFLVGLSILLIPYLMGGMGAGDVKLLALIGALQGMTFVIQSSIIMALLGALMAIFVIFARKGVWKRFKTLLLIPFYLRNGFKLSTLLDRDTLQKTYPYGVAISAGAFITLMDVGGKWIW